MNPIVKAVFCDIDGTLVDSNESHVLAWDAAFRQSGFPVERAAIRKQIGKGADMLIPSLLPDSTQKTRKQIEKSHGAIFKTTYLPAVQAFPAATELIGTLHARGIKVFLASSAQQDEVDGYIHLLKVKEFLSGTTSADDVNQSKPAGDIFETTLEKAAPISAREILAIGDTPYDASAANKCGIQTVALRSGGFSDAELNVPGTIAIYQNVGELLERLDTSPLMRFDRR